MKHTEVYAVILAAGKGIRALPMSARINKVLIPVNGLPLLWYSINNLLSVGVEKILIVVGYKAELIIRFVRSYFPNANIQFIKNEMYGRTNNITSYFLSKDFIKGHNYFRMEGDLIYSKGILEQLMKSKHPITVAVRSKQKFTGDEFRVEIDKSNNTIKEFGKRIPLKNAFGEAKGIEFVTKEASYLVSSVLAQLSVDKCTDVFSEHAYQTIIKANKNYIYFRKLRWYDHWDELDTSKDLTQLKKNFEQKYA